MHSEDYSAVAGTQDVDAYFFVFFRTKKYFVCGGDVEGANYLLNIIM